jgi:hypothetical protein
VILTSAGNEYAARGPSLSLVNLPFSGQTNNEILAVGEIEQVISRALRQSLARLGGGWIKRM